MLEAVCAWGPSAGDLPVTITGEEMKKLTKFAFSAAALGIWVHLLALATPSMLQAQQHSWARGCCLNAEQPGAGLRSQHLSGPVRPKSLRIYQDPVLR